MKNDLFEKAKQAVAEKHGKKEWLELCLFGANEMPTWYQEVAEWMCNEAVKDYFKFRPIEEWDEEMGECLFYKTPMCEAPIVTCPLSSDWVDGYFTHFLEMKKFPVPDEDGNAIPGNSRNKCWLPFPQQPEGKDKRTCIKCGKTLPVQEFYEAYNSTGSLRTDCKKCSISTALSREKRLRETDPIWLEKERRRQVQKVQRYRQSKKKS